ncbi:MAG: cupredoxin domain-containing protein [Acidimicrobiales bacterium]
MRDRPALARCVVLLLMVAGVAACGGSDSESPSATSDTSKSTSASSGVEVQIKDFAFAPERVEVPVGERVRWTNDDEAVHSVVIDGEESKRLARGGVFKHTFDEPGTVSYQCGIHNYMTGEIVVQ